MTPCKIRTELLLSDESNTKIIKDFLRVASILSMKKREECRLKLIVHFTEFLFYISIKTLFFRFKPMHKSMH